MPYLAPETSAEAFDFLRRARPLILAGGTDVFPARAEGGLPEDVLDITHIKDLQGIRRTATGWRIGAVTTWSDLRRADLPAAFDGVKAAAGTVGSVQIQNRATVAGNLCNASPAADGVPPLMTLDAVVELSSAEAVRRVPLGAFLKGVRQTDLGPEELVTAIDVPTPPEGLRAGFAKLGSRSHLVISIVMVAVAARLRDGVLHDLRIGVGSSAPVAQRLPAMEAALTGLSLDEAHKTDLTRPDLIAPLQPITDVRGSADFRRDVVGTLCLQALAQAFEASNVPGQGG